MGLFSRFKKLLNAAPTSFNGAIIVPATYSGGYQERSITPDMIADSRKVPKVLSSLITMSRLCFPGFDFKVTTIDGSDDTKATKIEEVTKQLKTWDKSFGRVGKARNVGLLGMIRNTSLEIDTFRQAVFEWNSVNVEGWIMPQAQALPGTSFATTPTTLAGQDAYVSDSMLPGVVYDGIKDVTRFFQTISSSTNEIEPGAVLYLQDIGIPDDTSFLGSLVPSILQWQEIRKYSMITMHRIGVPNEVAQIEPADIEKMVGLDSGFNVNSLVEYAKDLIQGQGFDTAKVSMPGMRLQYPDVSVPLNPWEADKFLTNEIISHFFARDILEVTAQAISATNAPAKALLDQIVSSRREVCGKPWEDWLYTNFLEPNGFGDLQVELSWWNITPKDEKEERSHQLMSLNAGTILVNDYRTMQGWPEYDDAQMAQLVTERQTIKPVGKGSQGGQV